MIIDDWKGMYPSAWKGIITPESFCHPAKVSSRLAANIYKHAIAEGWLHEGSWCVDPFGGIGGFAFHAMLNGMDMTLVELEPKFVALAQANIDAWNAKYSGRLARWGTARIIQGDSRHLAQVIGAAEACISSPPFMDNDNRGNREAFDKLQEAVVRDGHGHGGKFGPSIGHDYGTTPGNLGNLPPGNVEAVISSPPYAGEGLGHDAGCVRLDDTEDKRRSAEGSFRRDGYGSTPGQLAALPPGAFQAAISSPPYENCMSSEENGIDWTKLKKDYPGRQMHEQRIEMMERHHNDRNYGSGSDQLGNDSGETFWSAAREIVAQVYAVLAPGAHAIWVVKSYVKNKQLVDFPHQWQQLCESVGFVTLHEHHALLVRHGATSIDIYGNHHEKKTESKSFFRRLAEKNGSPRIDFETVLCMVKPGGEGGGWDGAISSPPFSDQLFSHDNFISPHDSKARGAIDYDTAYGTTPGQLGSLPAGSPPATRHGEGG